MTKRDVIWLLIRIAGAYFVWQGIVSSVSLTGTYVVASSTPELLSRSAGVLIQSILLTVLNVSLGWYLLLHGRIVYDLLNRQPDLDLLNRERDLDE